MPAGISADQRSDTAEEFADGRVTITSSDLELTEDKTRQAIGIRFRNLALKRGQKVPPTFIRFTVDETGSKPTRLTIHAEAADHAKEFNTQVRNISQRRLTRASVAWSPAPWTKGGESGPKQTTPNLSSLITEVIARPGWKPGNPIAFIITGTGKRVAKAGGPGAPKLSLPVARQIARTAPAKNVRPEKNYSVLLYFTEPDSLKPGERVFDIALQDKTVLKNVDLAKTAGQNHGLIKRFAGVRIADALKITLKKSPSATRQPILSGVELIAE